MKRTSLLFCIVVALLSIGVLTRESFADDPAGMPSTGSGVEPNGDTDADARLRVATLTKFVTEHQADADYASHEDRGARCKIDRDHKIVHLVFRADGVLHCKLDDLAEGYQFVAEIFTLVDYGSARGTHYVVSVKPGDRLPAAPVHGSVDDAKAALALVTGATSGGDWWVSQPYGPYHAGDLTITIALQEAGVSQDTKVTIAPLYLASVGVVAVMGPGTTTYAVTNGAVSSSRSSTAPGYYFCIQLYPLSWNHNGDGDLRPGRYFSHEYQSLQDRVSLVFGVSLSHPTGGGYVGVAFEVYDGISITAGWQPRKIQVLQSGHAVGEMSSGDTAPVDDRWDLKNWGVGLSLDGTLLKPLTAVFGK